MLRVLLARIRGLVSRGRTDSALDDDIQAHLELLTRDYIQRGLSPRDAQAAARRAFGGVAQMQETYRDQGGLPAIETFLQDLRYAARMLRRDPAFATVAILSLAIGIGASTAAFSVFNAVMLRPLAVPDPGRLVLLQPQRRGDRFILFNPIYEEMRERQTTLSGMFAANDTSYLKVIFDDEPAPVYLRASRVSGSYFAVLGVTPSMGRLLAEQDDQLPDALSATGRPLCRGHQPSIVAPPLQTESRRHRPDAASRRHDVRHRRDRSGHVRESPVRLRAGRLASITTAHGSEAARKPRDGVLLRCDGPAEARRGHRTGRVGAHDSFPAGAGR